MVCVNEKLEKAVSEKCKRIGLDDKIALELISRIEDVINSDFILDVRKGFTDELFDSIEDEDCDDRRVPLEGKVSWDDVYRLVDNYIALDWIRYN